ncbi:MAG: hypothetical protein ACFE9N_13530 [Promethearchaeota archaeon]
MAVDRMLQEEYEPTNQRIILGYAKAFVSFSNIDESNNNQYIYMGNEKIPFKQRHPEYQNIFIYEFIAEIETLIESYS